MTGYDAHGNFLPPQQLVDEIERLRAALKPFDEIERLRSENLALREALENINRIYLRLWVDTKLEKQADGSNRAD